ncbi:CLUMA_CG006808, isoform A [Clunio marinus]|uniref:CLUMA_CG006808, isoform A n=1 Tax=Clunio marinus TaxID=568069 RepID=A0A1J1I4F7_9DIPT|nr:CLUMA_CG006808, isoform A [Clunio marinus]
MENYEDILDTSGSGLTSNNFEFKYIPTSEFQRIMANVQRDRRLNKKGIWGDFCSVTEDDADEKIVGKSQAFSAKNMTKKEIESVLKSVNKNENSRRIEPTAAPFLGPSKVLDVETFKNEDDESKPSSAESRQSSGTLSVHIVEEVNIVEPSDVKIQVQNQRNVEEVASNSNYSDNENETLHNELMELCNEIENANESKANSGDDSSIDLSYKEDKQLRKIIEKNKEKFTCETYDMFIDKRFDFLNEHSKSSDEAEARAMAQTLPVVELKPKKIKNKKHASNDDYTNDNNVWIPKSQNQINKSDRQQESDKFEKNKDKSSERLPSDVIIRKARDVIKLKHEADEKSHGDSKGNLCSKDEDKKKLRLDAEESSTEILSALGKLTHFQSRMCQYLDFLSEIVQDPPEIEDINDLRRRQKRSTEFSNRFARNHLYQIGRVAEDIRVMLDNPVEVATKVNLLFQVMMQALQIYLKNIEMFIYNNNPDKLLVLVDFILNAMKICLERMVFDKRDTMVQQILRKCIGIKQFMEMNQESSTKFLPIPESYKKSLSARNSYACEVPLESKLSMYDMQLGVKPKRSNSRMNSYAVKSPYDVPKPRNFKATHKPKQTLSRSSSTLVRKTSSNISTMMEKIKSDNCNESRKTISEKPLEDSNVVTNKDSDKQKELLEMLEGITKQKFEEMFGSILPKIFSEMMSKQMTQESRFETPITVENVHGISETLKSIKELNEDSDEPPKLRVKSDLNLKKIPPVKEDEEVAKESEKIQHFDKNVQYHFVKSKSEKKVQSSNVSKEIPKSSEDKKKIEKAEEEKFTKEFKEQAMKERLDYKRQMSEDPLYVNKVISEPWKVFAKISDNILDDMLNEVMAELDFGEKAFVESFLRHEFQC